MTVGQRIVYYREKAELKQSELAEKVGITKQLLWKYETDRVDNIPLENLEKIADVLHIDPSILTGWNTESDDDFTEYLEELRTRPEMKMLFDSSRGMTPEQVKAIVAMIENFK